MRRAREFARGWARLRLRLPLAPPGGGLPWFVALSFQQNANGWLVTLVKGVGGRELYRPNSFFALRSALRQESWTRFRLYFQT